MFIFKPVFNWVLKYRKDYQHLKSLYILGMKILEDFRMGYEDLKGNLDGLWHFGEQNYISFCPGPGC